MMEHLLKLITDGRGRGDGPFRMLMSLRECWRS